MSVIGLTALRWMLVNEMEHRSGNGLLRLTQQSNKCFWITTDANITTFSHCAHFYTVKFNPYQFNVKLGIAFSCTRSNIELRSTYCFTMFYVDFP